MRLLTASEVSELLKVSKRTVHKYAKSGLLPCVKLNKRFIRFREIDIINFIEDKTIVYEPNEHVELIARKIIEKFFTEG